MSKIQFRLAARTDAAGKYNPNAPLEGNEDNMFVDTNLNSDRKDWPRADEVVDLSDLGCLMVVADGMGGMNAGEVASEIAIKTVTEYFNPQHLAGKTFRNSQARCKYMEEVVEAADANIKGDARVNKDHEGMGSTIIMGWLCDGEICLTWCGDSRAYLYRPGKGFWQVSKDHSYVQGLVDDGKITMDEAFDHPYGNIITRSLGDPEKRAKADSKVFPVFEGDIFMLCSDGLSGVLRDHKTYDADGQRIESENLEDIIDAHRHSMAECRDELFAAAERNDWYDNVTAILCEVVKGEPVPADMVEPPVKYPTPKAAYQPAADSETAAPSSMNNTSFRIRKKNLPLLIAGLVVLLGAVGFLVWKPTSGNIPKTDSEYFAYCKENQTIENYRSYVKKFPEGEFVELAKNWIQEWERNDSIEKAKQKGEEDGKESQIEQKEDKKSPKHPDKTGGEAAKDKTVNKEDNGNGTGDLASSFTPKEKENELTKVGTDDLNKVGTDGKKTDQNIAKVGETKKPSNEQEAYEQCLKLNTVEACVEYMDKYGDSKTRDAGHWNGVTQVFGRLYKARAKSCDTKEKCEDFKSKHDGIMKKSRMQGTQVDRDALNIVNDKLKELEKAEKQSGGGSRPATGTSQFHVEKK